MSLAPWSRVFSSRHSKKSTGSRKSGTTRKLTPEKLHLDVLEARQLLTVSTLGTEFRLSQSASQDQRLASPAALIQSQNNRSVAIDHDGDFVVTWSSYNDQDGDSGGVFARLYDRFGIAITNEFQVNQFFEGNQRNASVAMDADGDFTIVWESQGQDQYDATTGIYARRFNALGQPLGAEFQVNRVTVNQQLDPAISMDDWGNTIIVWENIGQTGSFFNEVMGQVIDRDGNFVGSQFRVNITNIPSSSDINPTVAMDPDGDFMVAWQLGDGIFSRIFDPTPTEGPFPEFPGFSVVNGTDPLPQPEFQVVAPLQPFTTPVPTTGEIDVNVQNETFLANGCHWDKPGTNMISRNPSITVDARGNFNVVFEMLADNDDDPDDPKPCDTTDAPSIGDSFGVFFRQIRVDGTFRVAVDTEINPVFTNGAAAFAGDQGEVAIAVDRDGDFATVYAGAGPGDGAGGFGSGVFLKLWAASTATLGVIPDLVNTTTAGVQRHPSIAMEPDGDFIVIWDGNGPGDANGVFAQRFDESTDTAGAVITDWLINQTRVVRDETFLESDVTRMVIRFSEQLNDTGKTGTFSAENINNWSLLRNGIEVTGGIVNVEFGFDEASAQGIGSATHKWEAVVTVDGDLATPGIQPLRDGSYEIVAKNTIKDIPGNPLASGGFNFHADPAQGFRTPLGNKGLYRPDGVALSQRFVVSGYNTPDTVVNTTSFAGPGNQFTNAESRQAIAKDADGNFVVVWTADDADNTGVFARRYTNQVNPATGQPIAAGNEFAVNSFTAGEQVSPAVAMDADGDFIISWSSKDPVTGDWNVLARRFDALGQPRFTSPAYGDREFRVNTHSTNNLDIHRNSTVAVDTDGDFIIAWQSYGQDGSGYGIYAQRFDSKAGRVGGTNETQLLKIVGIPGTTGADKFTLTLGTNTTAEITFDKKRNVTAAAIKNALAPFADVDVTANSSTEFVIQFVKTDAGRNVPELIGNKIAGSFTSIDIDTTLEGASSEFRVNSTTLSNQTNPYAAMDGKGRFVVTWTTFNDQDHTDPGTLQTDLTFESNVFGRVFYDNAALKSTIFQHPSAGFVATGAKWDASSPGATTIITYSYMPSGIRDVNNIDGGWTSSSIDSFMPSGARAQIRKAFDQWEEAANVKFVEVPDANENFGALLPASAHIRIGGHPIDGQFGVLAHAFFPTNPITGVAGDTHFDIAELWKTAFAGSPFGIDINQVTAHEIGHAIGLGHTQVPNSLMNPFYTESFRGPQANDYAGAQFLYGMNTTVGAITPEFLVNTSVLSSQKFPSVAMDLDGDIVFSWTSYGNDGNGNGYGGGSLGEDGVFVRRYRIDGSSKDQQEVRVNNFASNNQRFSTVSVDGDGDFVVTWTSQNQDGSGQGVYARRFSKDGPSIGNEFRVNKSSIGNQQFSSVAVDEDGEFVVVWSGPGVTGTDVYLRPFPKDVDDAGAIVTDVNYEEAVATIDQLTEGLTLKKPLSRMIVTFGEELDKATVENLNNWQILRGGAPLLNGIFKVEFGKSIAFLNGISPSESDKWEAIVTFDSDAVKTGLDPLGAGDYTLKILDTVLDKVGNPLDGNADGTPGGMFMRNFSIIVSSPDEFPVNNELDGLQTTHIESSKSVAMDGDGDLVSVWTTTALDGSTDIHARLFNAKGIPLAPEFTVNSSTDGFQRNATVAMDKDGDFIVTWTSYPDAYSPEADVYFRRFQADGTPQSQDVLVNTITGGAQKWSNVAMDVDGDFVITFTGTDNDSYGVYARRFSSAGSALATEFLVNNVNQAGTQHLSSVALDATGAFVISWTSNDGGLNGDEVFASMYNAAGQPVAGRQEFLVNTFQPGNQSYSSVARDLAGNFVITWSSDGQDGGGYGVYAKRFNPAGVAQADPASQANNTEFQVNVTTEGNQQFSSVAMDNNGDFVITWSGLGKVPGQDDDVGVFARRYTAAGVSQLPPAGIQGTISEFLVNTTRNDSQRISSAALSSSGDLVIVWSGTGDDDAEGILARVFDEPGDNTGPLVADVLYGNTQVLPGTILGLGVSTLVVTFDEEMSQEGGVTGVNSITNPNNWRLSRNGSQIVDGIKKVDFFYDTATVPRKFYAVLTLDGNGLASGEPSLSPGTYILTTRDFVRDTSGNRLDGNFDGTNGVDFSRQFVVVAGGLTTEVLVNNNPSVPQNTHIESPQAVASDADGDFVAAYTVTRSLGSGLPAQDDVFVRLFDGETGQALGGEFQVNSSASGQSAGLNQRFGSVARDADGDFVVTWTSYDAAQDSDIFARRYDALGRPQGDDFRVNTTQGGKQKWSTIAMDVDGDYVITWSSTALDGSGYGVYAQRYNAAGQALGAEFRVNSTTSNNQQFSHVAMDAVGNFIVTWTSSLQDSSGDGIYAKRFQADGTPLAAPTTAPPQENVFSPDGFEFQVNSTTAGNQRYARVAMTLDGAFVISWTSNNQDGSGDSIVAKRYDAAGIPQARPNQPIPPPAIPFTEFVVNESTSGNQQFSTVTVDHIGDFVIAWSGNGTILSGNNDDSGVFARRYRRDGTALAPPTGIQGTTGEFRVNNSVTGNQRNATVHSTGAGDFMVVWSGAGDQAGQQDNQGIFVRRFTKQEGDKSGPVVASVNFAEQQVMANQTLPTTVTQLVVTFGERMTTSGGLTGPSSIENLSNWEITRNGSQIIDGVIKVAFGENATTGRYEARLDLDGNGFGDGVGALPEGVYELRLRDAVRDRFDNQLDGDYNGVRGGDFVFPFIVSANFNPSIEFGVNVEKSGVQRTTNESVQSMTLDADGDFVTVYTSSYTRLAADGVTVISEDGIFARVFDRAGFPLTTELMVTEPTLDIFGVPLLDTLGRPVTVGNQRFGSVAVDKDGDFIVTWTGFGQDGDSSNQSNIYARRFSANGTPRGTSFLVNGSTSGSQRWSNVAVDVDGDFVVTWTGYGVSGDADVFAQRYNSRQEKQGQEILVNSSETFGSQRFSRVAVDGNGDFIIVYQDLQGPLSDADGDTIMARAFRGTDGTAVGAEFIVNTMTNGNQVQPTVAMDLDGDIVIGWASKDLATNAQSIGLDRSGYGVYFRRYNPLNPATNVAPTAKDVRERLVNLSITGDQQFPTVTMDHDGGFAFAWAGQGTQPGHVDSSGIFVRRFDAAGVSLPAVPQVSASTDEYRVNNTTNGLQTAPAIGVDGEGDFVVMWSGRGVGDSDGVFARQFDVPTDDDGPLVTDVMFGTTQVLDTTILTAVVTSMVVDFGEDLNTAGNETGEFSILNPENWSLFLNDVQIVGGIEHIEFSFNALTHKHQATVFFDGNGLAADVPELAEGVYELRVRSFVRDINGNELDGDANGSVGGDFRRRFTVGLPLNQGVEFRINDRTPDDQFFSIDTPQSVAADDDGDFVVVWTSANQDGDGMGIFARLLNKEIDPVTNAPQVRRGRDGNPIPDILITSLEQVEGDQINPAVAMDADGDFVVTWEALEQQGNNVFANVFFRKFNSLGEPLSGNERPTPVSGSVTSGRRNPSVAMDSFGNFAVSWTGFGQDGDSAGESNVYVRRFDAKCKPLGDEFRANNLTSTYISEDTPIAIPEDGTITSTITVPDNYTVLDVNVQIDIFHSFDGQLTAFLIAPNGQRIRLFRDLTFDNTGDNFSGTIFDDEATVNINNPTNRAPYSGRFRPEEPLSIVDGISSLGDWTLEVNDGTDLVFIFDGGQLNFWSITFEHGADLGDLTNNPVANGSQHSSIVAMDAAGNFVVVWEDSVRDRENGGVGNPEVTSAGIYGQRFGTDPIDKVFKPVGQWVSPPTGTQRGNFRVNSTVTGDQGQPMVAMDRRNGDFVVSWTSFQQAFDADGSGDVDADGLGVFAKRYNRDGIAQAVPDSPAPPAGFPVGEFKVNSSIVGDQSSPSVGMAADGSFVVSWMGDDLEGDAGKDIFSQRYSSTGRPRGGEFVVNTTKVNSQNYPSTAVAANGDFVVVWSGQGNILNPDGTPSDQVNGAPSDIFGQRFNEVLDTTGPVVASVIFKGKPVLVKDKIRGPVQKLDVTFGEEMFTSQDSSLVNSIRNPANWALNRGDLDNPLPGTGGVRSVNFRFDAVLRRWVATLTLDSDGSQPGKQAFDAGNYVLTLRRNARDVTGNALDGRSQGVGGLPGSDFLLPFTITGVGDAGPNGDDFVVNETMLPPPQDDYVTNRQDKSVTAMDAEGNYVVVWQSLNQEDDDVFEYNIYAQLYDQNGEKVGDEFPVNSSRATLLAEYATGSQIEPAVAMRSTGEFVVAWSGRGTSVGTGLPGTNDLDNEGIYAQRYNRFGTPVGDVILVNTFKNNLQSQPAVAVDEDGNFIITWTSFGQDSDQDGIFGRWFTSDGDPLDTNNDDIPDPEFQINNVSAGRQHNSVVAIDRDSDNNLDANKNGSIGVVVGWESYGQDGSSWGVFARRYRANFTARTLRSVTPDGSAFRVNSTTNDKQQDPDVAMDGNGNFIFTWASFAQDGDDYGVFFQRYGANGAAVGGESRANATTQFFQRDPSVAMDDRANFVITWTGALQDQSGQGIIGRYFASNGTPLVDPVTGNAEFIVNSETFFDQFESTVGMDASGNFAVAWTTPDDDPTTTTVNELFGIRSRRFNSFLPVTPQVEVTSSSIGLYRTSTSDVFTRNTLTSGFADTNFQYGNPGQGYVPIVGDWDGDGVDTVSLYLPSQGRFYINNKTNGGRADINFFFGPANTNWVPIAGDWDGDEVDSVGLYDPARGLVFLTNTLTTGFASNIFVFGPGNAGLEILVGDWNGDGVDTVGLYASNGGLWFLRNTNSTGNADTAFFYGPGGSNVSPIVGDWNGDETDTVGIYVKAQGLFYVRNTNTPGFADLGLFFGPGGPDFVPLIGDWNGPSVAQPLQLAASPLKFVAPQENLTQDDLRKVADSAIARWAAAGISQSQIDRLKSVQFVVSDLSHNLLGLAVDNMIFIDQNAAGYGWFVDRTPGKDEEFTRTHDGLVAVDRRAINRADLLSTVAHEMGHLLGLDDDASLASSGEIMGHMLSLGTRRNPEADDVHDIFGSDDWLDGLH